MGYFKNPEHEPIRVQKLNSLEQRVTAVETSGGGGSGASMEIDGGNATNSGTAYVAVDGGSA